MSKKPNILLFCSDQHMYSIAGYMGDTAANTPNLDSIAANGAVFEKNYCQSPCCTPSRMSFLTGKYCHNDHNWANHDPLFPEHKTIADYFSENGYTTCLIGKMHFGGNDQFHGFQHRPYGDLRHGLSHQPDPIDSFPNMQSGMMWDGPSQIPESLIQEVITATETKSFIKEHASSAPDRPWFVCSSFCRPHPPFSVPSRYYGRYIDKVPCVYLDDKDTAVLEEYPQLARTLGNFSIMPLEQNKRAREAYYACVDFIDDCIGGILRELERENLLENTMIVYISDHGDQIGNHGIWDKGTYYEESIRTPFVISGPGVPKGLRVKTMTGLIDLMPTLMELCGIKLPADIDGVSLTPFMNGDHDFIPHEYLITEYLAVSTVDRGNYTKASGRPFPSFRSVITQRYKYSETYETDVQGPVLFDSDKDPREFENVYGKKGYEKVSEILKAKLNEQHTIEEWAGIALKDKERAQDYRDHIKPSMPNQYMLDDGRIFDAEYSLYEARWLQTSNDGYAGYIPQRYH